MTMRPGQNGSVVEHGHNWRGRWLEDVPGQSHRIRRSILLGDCDSMTKPQARKKLREHLEKLGVNDVNYAIPSETPALIFAQAADQWIKGGLTLLKPSTKRTMRSQIRKHLRPRLLNVGVDRIDDLMVRQLIVEWHAQGLARNTIKNLIVTLGQILGRTFEDVKLPKRVDAREEARWFTPEQTEKIISGSTGMYKVLFATAAGTGMRAGELFGLRVEDVDLANSLIHVRRSVWEGKIQSPKTKNAYRQVGIDTALVEMLQDHLRGRNSGFVFQTRNSQPLRNGNTVKRYLWPVLDELKIERCGLHAFRHARVSFLVEHGVPHATIRAWIGHGSDRMVELYTHSRAEFHASVLAKLPSMFGNEKMRGLTTGVTTTSSAKAA